MLATPYIYPILATRCISIYVYIYELSVDIEMVVWERGGAEGVTPERHTDTQYTVRPRDDAENMP